MSGGRLCWKLGKTQREVRSVLWMLKLSELYVLTSNIGGSPRLDDDWTLIVVAVAESVKGHVDSLRNRGLNEQISAQINKSLLALSKKCPSTSNSDVRPALLTCPGRQWLGLFHPQHGPDPNDRQFHGVLIGH